MESTTTRSGVSKQAGLGKQRRTGIVQNDDRVDWREAYELFGGDVAYVWHAGLYAGEVATSLQNAGFDIRSQIIWAKQHFALSRGNYHWQHEPCWYGCARADRLTGVAIATNRHSGKLRI